MHIDSCAVVKYSFEITSILLYPQNVISNSLVDVIFTITIQKVQRFRPPPSPFAVVIRNGICALPM